MGLQCRAFAELSLERNLLPLPYPQLAHLQLWGGEFSMAVVLVMTSELPRLETLELLNMQQEPDEHEAVQLSQLPNLRTVNCSSTPLWDTELDQEPQGRPPWVPICECMPRGTEAQLTLLRQAAPHINWVLDDMDCYAEQDMHLVCPRQYR